MSPLFARGISIITTVSLTLLAVGVTQCSMVGTASGWAGLVADGVLITEAVQTCTNDAAFVADVTIPPGMQVSAGQTFVKTWRMRNVGTCTWAGVYSLDYHSGERMAAPPYRLLQAVVRPGDEIDISVQLTAPAAEGKYSATWQLSDPSYRVFGPNVYVQIEAGRLVDDRLPDTLTYFPAGGAAAVCAMVPPRVAIPRVEWSYIYPDNMRVVDLCVYGLPANSIVTVSLRGPTGSSYSAQFRVGQPRPGQDDRGDYSATMVAVPFKWPANLPRGKWELTVDSSGLRHRDTIVISDSAPQQERQLTILAPDSFSPFDTVFGESIYALYTHSYPAGSKIELSGTHYPANIRFPVGIYFKESEEKPTVSGPRIGIIYTQQVTTDKQGAFTVPLRIPVTWRPGLYWAVAWLPDSWDDWLRENARGDDGTYQILGLPDSTAFVVRAAVDSPFLRMHIASPTEKVKSGQPFDIRVWVENVGRPATRGGSITVSSPSGHDLSIVGAGVPILPLNWTNCGISSPHAWVLTPRTPCHKALQRTATCNVTKDLRYPLAEGWYLPWSTNQAEELTVRVTPKPGAQSVTLYVRAAALSGTTGCNLILAPDSNESSTVDQQGFPVRVITVDVSGR